MFYKKCKPTKKTCLNILQQKISTKIERFNLAKKNTKFLKTTFKL